MQTIHVSPDFPLNRRMRKAVRRGKLEVVREGGEAMSSASGDLENRRRFIRELREIIDPCEGLRPFVCRGFPLECKVFLVGYNPATSDLPDFWQFFGEDGFDKDLWLRKYKEERIRLGRPPVSNTRQRMDALVENIRSSRCLETNLYPKPSASAGELRMEFKDPRVLEFLLEKINPRVIVAYNRAQETIPALLGAGKPRPSEIKHADIADGKNGESIVLIKGSPLWSWGMHPPADANKPHVLNLAKLVDNLAESGECAIIPPDELGRAGESPGAPSARIFSGR